jgi:phosphatidylglycerophosphate synthase
MLSSKYRDMFSPLFSPIAERISGLGITPNHLTVLGAFLSATTGLLFAIGEIHWGGVVLGLAGLCDCLDGSVARVSNAATPFGAFLDSTVDRYSDMFIFGGLLYQACSLKSPGLFVAVFLALLGSVMVSYTRARAESLITSCQVGIAERPERVILLIAGALLGFLWWAVIAVAILANVTAIQRILHTKAMLEREGEDA